MTRLAHLCFATVLLAGCSTAGAAAPGDARAAHSALRPMPARRCAATPIAGPGNGPRPRIPSETLPRGFQARIIANVPGARELAALPNGDLLVGTLGSNVDIVPHAEADGSAGTPRVFATLNDDLAQGVTFAAATCTIYVATEHAVWAIPYTASQRIAARIVRVARVRTGPVSPGTDGDVHRTTSVGFANGILYVGVGSSCNACTEVDPTRAAVLTLIPGTTRIRKVARRIRNPIAFAADPATGAMWVGGAGQDDLPAGHPYEFLDDLNAHPPVADYGWPDCEENRHPYVRGARCAHTVVPRVELPAYSTIIGAVFYPRDARGRYAFPRAYRGDLFAAAHGSWHDPSTTPGLRCASPAQVVAVPMHGDRPATPVDWADPTRQWHPFFAGFQTGCSAGERIGRPTGLAVGPRGSLFVADDANGVIYRIRPSH